MANERINPDQIDNSELVSAIKDMRADFKPETQNRVINLALRSAFFLPGIVKKQGTGLVQGNDGKVSFEKTPPQVTFLMIKNEERGTFFPAFTDREECLRFKSEREFSVVMLRFADLANLCERSGDQGQQVNGFVINPYSEALPFTNEILQNIKDYFTKQKKARAEAEAQKNSEAAEEDEKPNITMSTNPNA
ncbi:MAG: SseB family protein [Ruminococcus sp.]|nr:SseB family protein [Ruminococcus sp.]MBR4622786.1 SseB family protein [Ruminococcus sp.]